jgi:hypothetical protein
MVGFCFLSRRANRRPQMAQAIDLLVFNERERLCMERQAHQRGCQMRWDNSAWALLQFADFIREEKDLVTGRGPKSIREKPSRLDIYKYKQAQVAPAIEAVTLEPQV